MLPEPIAPFPAVIEIIGVNPFVAVPDAVLHAVLAQAGRRSGPVPVRLTIDGHPFPQTLVRFAGQWRLYLNGPMRQAAGKQVGDAAVFTLAHDPASRALPLPPELGTALAGNAAAQAVFEGLPASRRLEIVRYIARLKSPESVARNVARALRFLLGQERFVGRDRP